ncbi:hypothetical protein [Acinetobacter baumannii]|nr:hypothetical protein [Acinetobacter baumannii]
MLDFVKNLNLWAFIKSFNTLNLWITLGLIALAFLAVLEFYK